MSFGFSVGDFIQVAGLIKKIASRIKSAPHDFLEVEKTVQSLDILLDSVRNEIESSTSALKRNPGQEEELRVLVCLCSRPLKRLDDILTNFRSLKGDRLRIWKRTKFPKTEVLQIERELTLRYDIVHAFLDTIGLGGIGRIEHKVNEIGRQIRRQQDEFRQQQSSILAAIDRIVLNNRSMESFLSDHTNDDKTIWRQFRRELNIVGFTSTDIETHKPEIVSKLTGLKHLAHAESDIESISVEHGAVTRLHTTIASGLSGAEDDRSSTSEVAIDQAKSSKYDYEIHVGKRSPPNVVWQYRGTSSEHTLPKPSKDIRDNTLPDAAAAGHTAEVLNLLLALHNIEAIGTPFEDRKIDEQFQSQQQEEWYDRTTALFRAAMSGHFWTADMLLRYGANPNPREKNGSTLAFLLASKGETHLLRLLLEYGAEIENQGALQAASARGHLSVAKLFLEYGALTDDIEAIKKTTAQEANAVTEFLTSPVNTTTSFPCEVATALNWAAYEGHSEIVSLLLSEGANANFTTVWGESCLSVAVDKESYECVRLLLLYGADPMNGVVDTHKSILYEACCSGREDVVELLLLRHADPDDGCGRYTSSVNGGDRDFEKLKADCDRITAEKRQKRGGWAPLHAAARVGNCDMGRLLLEYGADINIRSKTGITALEEAAYDGHSSFLQFLVEYGADLDISPGFQDLRVDQAARDSPEIGHYLLHQWQLRDIAENDPWSANFIRSKARRGCSCHLCVVGPAPRPEHNA